ncbi:MAG: sodium:proton antiporter [Phycisphaerales bacterium]|nr:sodium:proton antiporter [Phycisphaerales bacterium]
MIVFEWVLAMLVGAMLLSAFAHRLKVPYPVFLAVGGAAMAFIPSAPQLVLEPELALALFVAPVLLDAAYDTSVRDLKENWLPVGSLVIVAVTLTAATVAIVVRFLVPSMPWAAAVALGAIVAPPDAAAATAVLRQVRLPHRLLVILEGESLLNDASALLIYRVAVTAVAGGLSSTRLASLATLVVPGSILFGALTAPLYTRLLLRIKYVPSNILMQFIGTFGMWLLAERLGLSGILTVVTFGIVLARQTAESVPARVRVPSFAVWETVVFVLNVLAFVVVGLQLRPIWERLSAGQRSGFLGVAAAVLLTVILVRIGWVMTYNALVRWKIRRFGMRSDRPLFAPTVQSGLIISWCGMRGIVTLAAALALPEKFPHRDLIVLCAFAVVLGTLLIQGLTIRPLLSRLKLRADTTVEDEKTLARCAALRAGIAAIDGDESVEANALRAEFQDSLRRALEDPQHRPPERLAGDEVRRRAVVASRHSLAELRSKGRIGDAAYHSLEEEFDWLELATGGRDES